MNGARGVSSSVADLPDFSAEWVYYYGWPEVPLSARIAAHWQQAEAYRLRENSPILTLPDALLGLLPLKNALGIPIPLRGFGMKRATVL
jgi:hypothetical protein